MGLSQIRTDSWRLSEGLAIGLLLAFGFQYVPLVVAGVALTAGWSHGAAMPLSGAIFAVIITSGTYVLAAATIRLAFHERQIDLFNFKHLWTFLLLTPLAGGLAAVAAIGFMWSRGAVISQTVWSTLLSESASNAMGIVLFTPAFMLIFAPCVERALAKLAGEQWLPNKTDSGWKWQAGLILAGAVLCSVVTLSISDRFIVACLISAPLVASALKYGNAGVALMLLAFGCLTSGAAAYGFGFADTLGIQAAVTIAAANALVLGSSITQSVLKDATVKRQSALLNSVRFASEGLLAVGDREETVKAVLQQLATEAGMARAYVLENRPDMGTSQPIYTHWCVGKPDDLKQSELDSALFKRIQENAGTLSVGEVLQYSTVDLPEQEQKVLLARNIHRSIIVPIFMHDRWWGCLGLDHGPIDGNWPEADVAAFKAAGRVLVALLSHANVEQQFRELTGNIPAIFWIATPDGLEKTYVSPAYEQIWGWPYENILANPRSWLATVYHEDYDRINAAIPKQILGEYDEEYRIVRSDRSVRWIRETAFPARDAAGQVTRIVGIAQDITRQKEAEERLEATSVLLSSLIDNLHAGIVVEDQSRRVIHVNQAFCRMFNYSGTTSSLIGRHSKLAFPVQQEWSDRIDVIIQERKECRNEEMVSATGQVFCRDYFPLQVDGDRQYHLWRYEDITDRKRSEERIRASLKEKEVLLKEIHHRVKNNLQVISSLMNLQANQLRDKEIVEAFRDSQARVKAMSLVHERLYQSSDLAQIDFAGYVRDVTNHLLRSYQNGRHPVRLKVDVEPVSLNIDTAIPCALIINELVSNSLKYAFPNGQSGEIQVSMNHTDTNDLNLRISDNGVGFPETLFWRNSDSLGLQLVRNLTDQLNGSIKCHLQQGAQFDIRFRPNAGEYKN
jgi:PAS domain S-box-containing protein